MRFTTPGRSLETYFIEARYQTFINLRRTILGDPEYARWLKPLPTIADDFSKDLLATDASGILTNFERKLLTASLSLFLEHEIAHLDPGSPFSHDVEILEASRLAGEISQDAYTRSRRTSILEEERRADQVALDKAERLIRSQFPADAKVNAQAKEALIKSAMLGMSALFRDRALFLVWTNSRNFGQKISFSSSCMSIVRRRRPRETSTNLS
jgi:hypothetical protein